MGKKWNGGSLHRERARSTECASRTKNEEARVATGGWDPPGASRCAMIRLRDGLIVELLGAGGRVKEKEHRFFELGQMAARKGRNGHVPLHASAQRQCSAGASLRPGKEI